LLKVTEGNVGVIADKFYVQGIYTMAQNTHEIYITQLYIS
jgi:hypothetical protein